MAKYFEIDFLEAGNTSSGDAIALRYTDDVGEQFIHVVDGGYSDDGDKLVTHINTYYGEPTFIDHVVLTHPDGDHAAGLKTILETYNVGTLWMNRPWEYVDELMPLFKYEYTRNGLIRRLKEAFSHTAALEELANEQGINIKDAFQGAQIGEFTVLAPSKDRYIDLVVESEKTPEPVRKEATNRNIFEHAARAVKNFIAEWGQENLKGDTEGTSAQNEASIIQYAMLCDEKILLTGDAGVNALTEAHEYAIALGIDLPGIKRFQVPHHGSRRNLSSDVLDAWLGEKHGSQPGNTDYTAIISANQKDKDHPKKAVVRALTHRGAMVIQTDKTTCCHSAGAPGRGWSLAVPLPYPTDMEE